MQTAARQELARRNPDSLLQWAEAYRSFRGEPMRLIPALRDLYRDRHPFIVIQKAAQVGISEFLINTALWAAETGQGDRGNVLYVMPTQTQTDDFSQARFDKAIAESPYLMTRLHPPPPQKGGAARVQLKRLGQGYIYLRGSESRRQLTSVDADVVLLDEYDLMGEGVLELAQKRLASSQFGWLRVVSTPRLPEAGINELFLQSDQRYYFMNCPACGYSQRLEWEHNVDLERAQVVCRRSDCRKPLDSWAPGHWEAARPGNLIRCYHLSRLYSPWANLRAMIEASEATTLAALQEFQNSDLGETFVAPGGGLNLDVLSRCRGDYGLGDYAGQPCEMGVDVGLSLHVVVRERLPSERGRPDGSGSWQPRLWFAGQVAGFPELEALMERYQVRRCVVDSMPELHLAREFALRHKGKVRLAQYGRQQPGHERKRGGLTEPNRYLVNRAEILDETFRRFHDGVPELPRDAQKLGGRVKEGYGEYYRELLALKRTLERNDQGNVVARWLDSARDDHYAHAEAYCLLAGKDAGVPVFGREDIDKACQEEVETWEL